MEDKNKLLIDLTITGDEKLIDEYTKSFDNLRRSLNSLSQPVNSLSNSVANLDKDLSKYRESLGQVTTKNNEFISTGEKVNEKVSSITSNFGSWLGTLDLLKLTIKGWTVALTGGLSIVLAFLPEIVNLVGSFFKGKDAVAQMTDKMKGFNEVMKAANSDTATQTAKLNLLYKSATDVKKSDEERAESIRLLKKEYPDYFKHLSDEDFKNGKANESYLKLTRTLIENARAKAALNKITEESAKILDAEFKMQKIKGAHSDILCNVA